MQSKSEPRRTMARAWTLAALLFMVICAYVVVAGSDFTYLDQTGPGPGFFPVWVGGLGLLTGAGLLWFTKTKGPQTVQAWTWPAPHDGALIVLTIVALAVAGAAIEFLGFRLTILLFVAGLLRLYGMRAGPALASAAACALLVHFVFNDLLRVLLPTGVLGV